MDRSDIDLAVRVTAFWSLIPRGAPDLCWEWEGYSEDGYGRYFFQGRMRFAHDLAVMFTTGEVRHPSYDTCHSCDNPPCCNPSHLRYDTRSGNVQDAIRAGTHAGFRCKLSDEQVVLIRERHALGATGASLAREFGASNGYISNILTGKDRPNVGGPIRTPSFNNGREGKYGRHG